MCGIFGLISLRDKKIHTQHLRESNNFYHTEAKMVRDIGLRVQ